MARLPRGDEEFSTEVELCAAFMEWFSQFPGWTAYPETHSWDILLAHTTQATTEGYKRGRLGDKVQALDRKIGKNR